jgi:hypothetical protein
MSDRAAMVVLTVVLLAGFAGCVIMAVMSRVRPEEADHHD